MTLDVTSKRRRRQPHEATRERFKPVSPSGARRAAVGILVTLALVGCASTNPRPKVIAVPGEDVPHKIQRGEASEYDGWVLPTPLFNKLTPCFKDVLEHPEPRSVARIHFSPPFACGAKDALRQCRRRTAWHCLTVIARCCSVS